jgi:hypothetical protein
MSDCDQHQHLLTNLVRVINDIERKVPRDKLSYLLNNQAAVEQLTSFLINDCSGLPEAANGIVLQNYARRLLGRRFVSCEEWFTAAGHQCRAQVIERYNVQLPNVGRMIELAKSDLILIPRPMVDLTIIDLLEHEKFGPYLTAMKNLLCGGTPDSRRLYETAITDEVTAGGWLAVRASPVSGSEQKELRDQLPLLSKRTEYLPNLAEAVYAIVGYQIVRQHKLFSDEYVRVGSTSMYHQHFYLGLFQEELKLGGGEMRSDESALQHMGILAGDNLRAIADDFDFRT